MEAPRHLYRHAFQLRILLGERERQIESDERTDGQTDREGETDRWRERGNDDWGDKKTEIDREDK